MKITIGFEISIEKKIRNLKGSSIIDLPDDYIVLDLETTGLEPDFDEIIEIGAIKIKNNEIIDTFNTLVKPMIEIDEFIVKLTGINNDIVKDAPGIEEVIDNFVQFVGDSVIIGHNVNFDINFIYDSIESILNKPFNNNFIDLLRISRKLSPNFENHKLKTLAANWQIDYSGAHRAIKDCYITDQLYRKYKLLAYEIYTNKETFIDLFKRNYSDRSKKYNLKEIVSEYGGDSSFYKEDFVEKIFVFTGTLEKLHRKEAAQIVVNLGGSCENGVTKNTNYLVLGSYDYANRVKNGKSKKLLKAEELVLSGHDLTIIAENSFYEMISEELNRFTNNREGLNEKSTSRSKITLDNYQEEINARNITTSKISSNTDLFIEEEIRVFQKVKEILIKAEKDITSLRCSRLSTGEFDISLFASMIRFKIKTKNPYILMDENAEEVDFSKFTIFPAASKEYGKVRMKYQDISDLDKLQDFLTKKYENIIDGNDLYIKNVACGLKNYIKYLQSENFYK